MSSRVLELLDLAIRWVHVIAGIMWIGNSMLFNWLDRNLGPTSRGGAERYGEIWLLHSGAFYFVEKTSLSGQPLPKPVHWFKWQAYITWLSGAALLLVVYYVGGRALLTDPSRADLSPGLAAVIAAGSIVFGWLAYELVWRVVGARSLLAAGVLSIAALVGIACTLTSLLSGRAAFLHLGALIATIMAGNVATTIMPSQRVLESAVAAGRPPDPAFAVAAKTRSIHNNYLTFPVIVLMLSAHFPSVYGLRWNWLALLLLIAVGAAARHLLNIRYTYRAWAPTLALTIGAALGALFVMVRLDSVGAGNNLAAAASEVPATVSFADVRSIIDRRCTACHSGSPSITEFGPSPAGISFEDPGRIAALAERIRVRTVETRTMPPGNRTLITDRERAMLAKWIAQQASRR